MMYNANKWQSINKTNQESTCTYNCAGQKLTALFSIHCYIKLFSFNFECSLQDSLQLLYVLCKSSSSNWLQVRNAWYLYKISLVCFFMFTMWTKSLSQSLFTMRTRLSQSLITFHSVYLPFNWLLSVCSHHCDILKSHVSLRRIDFSWIQWFSWHSKGILLVFTWISNSSSQIFLFVLSRLHSNIFCLLVPDWFDDLSLVVVVLLDDNSGIRSTGRKLLSWAFISSVHSSSLSSLNVVLPLIDNLFRRYILFHAQLFLL